MKKKIAMVGLLRGGIGHYIAELSVFLARDFDLEYISYKYGLPGDEVKLDDPAIAKHLIKKPHFIIAYNNYHEVNSTIKQLTDFLEKNKIDILNIHVGTIARETAYLLISFILIAKKMNIKILYTFHDVESFEEFSGGPELLKLFYSLTDIATVGGEKERQKLLSQYNIPESRVAIAPHGIYSIFDFKKFDQKTARRHLNIPPQAKVILHFGIYRPYKGVDDLIKAMPSILKKNPDAYLYISSGLRLFKDVSDLKKLVKDLKLTSRAKLNFEFVNSAEIEPIFKAADVVVLPYRQVSQSGILNIALYFEKPVIVSDLFVEAPAIDRRLGLVVPPSKPEEIAKAVDKLIKDTSLYRNCVEGMKKLQENNLWAENAEAVKKLIEGGK